MDFEEERKRLIAEIERHRHSILCTSGDHLEPMFVLATSVCLECAAAACSEHEMEHDETCERGARLARLRTQTPLDEDDIFSGGKR